jgi:hypothetical protein
MSKGGGSQTTTTTQSIDPYIKQLVGSNVDRAKGIADSPFQAYTGNPYKGVLGDTGMPAVAGHYEGGGNVEVGIDDYGQPIYEYRQGNWVEGTPAVPGADAPQFDPNNFVAPLSANQNMAINAAPGLLGAGQGAINAGIQGAAGLLNYQPGQINPATAGTSTAGATGYNPALLGSAPQTQAAGYNASLTGQAPQAAANTASAFNANPALLGSAPQMQAANANAASAGNASTAQFNPASLTNATAAQAGPAATAGYNPASLSLANSAQINRGAVGNVGANSGLGGIGGYQNQYTNDVVNSALSDIDLFRQRALGGNLDRAVFAGGLNGSRQGVADSLTNEAAIREAGATAARLRSAGFDMAANLAQQDASRAQQGQAANQAVDLSVAGQNAGFNQQTGLTNASSANQLGLANASNALNAGQFNAGQQNNMGQFNAGLNQQSNLTNAAAANNMGQFNSQGLFGASQFNAGAQNNQSQFNAGNQQQSNLFNAGNQQSANAANTGLLADFMRANQSSQNAADMFNAQNQTGISQFNAGALNNLGQFNAGLQNTNQLANQGALNQAGQFNASNAQNTGQFNAGLQANYDAANQGAQNQAGQFGASAANAANIFNAGALNQGGQYNASAINQAQAQNQQAGLAGAGLNAAAAGLLGTLGGQQQGLLGNAINTLGATGAMQQGNQQAGLDAAWQEFLRMQNQPYVGQSLINQSLGLLPQGGTTTQTSPKPDQTGSTLQGLGSMAAAAAMMFSDGRLKEDVTFSGYDNENRRWYTYRYIWDEHGMRRRGVIAQEIMDSDPHAVHVHPSGYLMVDYNAIGRKH